MANTRTKWLLRCMNNPSQVFELLDKVPIILGRNRATGIGDKRCSRTQVRVIADYSMNRVTVEQVGPNPSGVNGATLTQGEEKIIQEGDSVEVLLSEYIYKLEIPEEGEGDTSLKRKSNAPPESNQNNTKKMSKDEKNKNDFFQDNKNLADGKWEEEKGLIIFTSNGVVAKEKIAGFDLDGTLITTISGNVFPKHKADWQLLFSGTSKMLKQCFNDGYKIVIFTNQGGLETGKIKLQDFKWRIERIVNDLGVPIQVFASTKRDTFRKPITGMWDYLVAKKNDNIPIEVEESFYCGDAAGRPANTLPYKKKKDHSSSDRLFAVNIDCKFYTPEEYFRNIPTTFFDPPYFSPSRIMSFLPVFPPTISLKPKEQEIAIMVGCSGSGKSTFVEKYLLDVGYIQISRDELGTWQKCTSTAMKILKEDHTKSVIIDNTNPDVESRKRYIDLAKQMRLKIRAFCMTTTQQHAHHNNKFRQLTSGKDIPANIVINNFFSKYVEPEKKEGFYEIVNVNFIPKFDNADEERLYNMYLLEK